MYGDGERLKTLYVDTHPMWKTCGGPQFIIAGLMSIREHSICIGKVKRSHKSDTSICLGTLDFSFFRIFMLKIGYGSCLRQEAEAPLLEEQTCTGVVLNFNCIIQSRSTERQAAVLCARNPNRSTINALVQFRTNSTDWYEMSASFLADSYLHINLIWFLLH